MTKHRPTSTPAPQPHGAPHLEDKITEAAEGVIKTAKNLAMPALIGVSVVVVAILCFFAVQRFTAWRTTQSNEAIYALLQKPAEEVRKEAPKVLEQLRGKPREVVFALEYGQWLQEQGDAEEALRVARDVMQRHEKEELLSSWLASLESFNADNAKFKLPEIEQPGPPADVPPGTEGAPKDPPAPPAPPQGQK